MIVVDISDPRDDVFYAQCRRIAATWSNAAIIVVTSRPRAQMAMLVRIAGVYDVVERSSPPELLLLAVRRAARFAKVQRELDDRDSSPHTFRSAELVGDSLTCLELRHRVEELAPRDCAVLLTGEPGCDLASLSRDMHEISPRRAGPWKQVTLDSERRIEAILFGRGSASRGADNLFFVSRGGTLFIDQIDCYPSFAPDSLLRLIAMRHARDHDVRVMGGSSPLGADTSVREPDPKVEVVPVPPLRERNSDILAIASHLLAQSAPAVSKIDARCRGKLLDYPWPGNLRELRQALEQAAASATDGVLHLHHLPAKILEHEPPQSQLSRLTSIPTLAELEEQYLRHVLQAVEGNKVRAAAILGISRRSIYRRLKRHAIS